MSQNLMKTEIGGEQTQYESIHTHMEPHKKSGGQFGNPETEVDASSQATAQANAEKGEKSAEKIRYGQALSENGMGGQTIGSGEANPDGFGGVKSTTEEEGEGGAASEREKSGYGGKADMDTEIGG